MPNNKHFIMGVLAPFGPLLSLTTGRRTDRTVRCRKKSGFERDAENLRRDGLAVGTFVQNAVNDYEREFAGRHK
jgi:hypothetical protein